MMRIRIAILAALIALPNAAVQAQGKPAAAKPAKAAASPAKPADETVSTPADPGTTIIGDTESPIGLYITPWKDEFAERGLDRPARLLDEAMEPIDPATFRRQIKYYETITAYRRGQQQASEAVAPAAPPAAAPDAAPAP